MSQIFETSINFIIKKSVSLYKIEILLLIILFLISKIKKDMNRVFIYNIIFQT